MHQQNATSRLRRRLTRRASPIPNERLPRRTRPDRLVSGRNGDRAAVQWGESANAVPVFTNPLSSRSISSGSQLVQGSAPMKLKTAGVSTLRCSPVVCCSQCYHRTQADDYRPESEVMVVLDGISIFGVCSIRCTSDSWTCSCPGRRRESGPESSCWRGPDRNTAAYPRPNCLRPPRLTGHPTQSRASAGARGVVHAGSLESLKAFYRQSSVLSAGGDQQALGGDALSAIQLEHGVAVFETQTRDRAVAPETLWWRRICWLVEWRGP